MEAGAKGCLIVIAGKLTGQRHRTVKFKAGHVKYCGEPRNQGMRLGFAGARLKPGVIGVTVEIMDPMARLPDEITIKAPSAAAPAVATPPPPAVLALPKAEPAEEPAPKGKVAARKLKKEIQKLRETGEDAGVVPADEPKEDEPPGEPGDES